MKRVLATLTGMVLASGLALAATGDQPEDLVSRYYASTDKAGLAASWQDWHPNAVHSITLKLGMGQKDERFSYKVADWETLPDWQDDPEIAEALKSYTETKRSVPKITLAPEKDGVTLVTAVTRVEYPWSNYNGQMTQTDRFQVTETLGRLAIRSLDTIYDYR